MTGACIRIKKEHILSFSCLAALWSGGVTMSSLGCTLGKPESEQNQLRGFLRVAQLFLRIIKIFHF